MKYEISEIVVYHAISERMARARYVYSWEECSKLTSKLATKALAKFGN